VAEQLSSSEGGDGGRKEGDERLSKGDRTENENGINSLSGSSPEKGESGLKNRELCLGGEALGQKREEDQAFQLRVAYRAELRLALGKKPFGDRINAHMREERGRRITRKSMEGRIGASKRWELGGCGKKRRDLQFGEKDDFRLQRRQQDTHGGGGRQAK